MVVPKPISGGLADARAFGTKPPIGEHPADLGVSIEEADLHRELVGVGPIIVRIQERDEFAAAVPDAAVTGRRDSKVLARDQPHARVMREVRRGLGVPSSEPSSIIQISNVPNVWIERCRWPQAGTAWR